MIIKVSVLCLYDFDVFNKTFADDLFFVIFVSSEELKNYTMKKPAKVIIGILITVTIALITFRAIDHEPVNSLPLDKKVGAITQNSGCNLCHTKDHKLPWYSGVPVLNSKLKRDMAKGIKEIDLSDVYIFSDNRTQPQVSDFRTDRPDSLTEDQKSQIANGNSQGESNNSRREVILNKLFRIDRVMEDHSMPPISFTILRPGSAVNAREREIMLQWNTIKRNQLQF